MLGSLPLSIPCSISRQARRKDILSETPFSTTPELACEVYTDVYGNIGRRLFVPAGLVTLSYRAEVQDTGLPETTPGDAPETPVQELPEECLPFLSGSRYCETDKLSQFAWDTFGPVKAGRPTRPGHRRLRPQSAGVRLSQGALDAHSCRGLGGR